jgi:cholesterol oxidase
VDSGDSARTGEHDRLDADVVVVGSGFGGSVTALRLTEKGYRVAVLETGRRFDESTYPKTSWRLRSFLWAPALGCYGLQRISVLKDVMVLSGAGVGGGSLLYANTLYEPLPPFFDDPQWASITDWRDELAPAYDQAKRMLGVVPNPTLTPSDEVMLATAEEMGVADTFHTTPVGVFFGDPGEEVEDPFFGGAGPSRRGCIECGECMTGCRHGAKNTLLKNYLYLAERAGAVVHPLTTVTRVRPRPGGGYAVETVPTGARLRKERRTFTAEHVVFAAGTLGTQKLLHAMRDEGSLPRLSARLGELTRTNSEAILGARTFRRDADFTRGVAITSSFHPDDHTHIEPVRYGKGSNAMGMLVTGLVDGGQGSRIGGWLREFALHPVAGLRAMSQRRWSEQTIIALVMQTRDNSITCYTRPGRFGRRTLTSTQGHGEPNPTWIPVGHDAVRRIARRIGGFPGGGWNDIFNIPMTAHFLGGAVIGDSAETGVIDPYHRVYGHPGLHVVDGAAVSANLGVNPSLTITAQAERAVALWPNAGEEDRRPALGEPYRRVDPVAPLRPVVPASAPGALRLAVGKPRTRTRTRSQGRARASSPAAAPSTIDAG